MENIQVNPLRALEDTRVMMNAIDDEGVMEDASFVVER
jgi:hypothetical protein